MRTGPDNLYAGDLSLVVDFSTVIGAVSGAITNVVEATDGPQTGTLTLGALPAPFIPLNRGADIVTTPVRTFSTFATDTQTGGDTLTDSDGNVYTVDARLGGDFLGTDLAAVGGAVVGTITRGTDATSVNGAFYAPETARE